MIEKADFLKNVTVYCDTSEQKNAHIKKQLDGMGVRYADKSLDFGDYSFEIGGKDFSMLCVIERKANVDELYGNITSDRERIEREFNFATSTCNDFSLLIERCESYEHLKNFQISDEKMIALHRQRQDIGTLVYQTLQSWKCGNRYHFNTIFVASVNNTAVKMLEHFYYYYRNWKMLGKNRKLKKEEK